MTKVSPFFSIVLPTYNRASLIGPAIRSVLNQRFEDFELIIVDDGSTDNTKEVVQLFNDPRILYFYVDNQERSIARNFGIEQSSGKYVNFLDSDDFFYPDHLLTAFQSLREKRHPELLHLDFEIQLPDGTKVAKKKIVGPLINRMLIYENTLCGASFFIRKDVLLNHFFIPHRDAIISEDWYLWLRLASRFIVHYVDHVTCVVKEHDQRSLRTVHPEKTERSLLLVMAKLEEDPVFLNFYNRSFTYFRSECYSLIALHYASVNRSKSAKYLVWAIFACPVVVKRKRVWAIVRNLILKKRR